MKKILPIILALLLSYGAVMAQQLPFKEEIAAFKKSDSVAPPPSNAILFVGSSSFRLWKNMQADFPGYTVINRGFGGSTLTDVITYANDIIFPYKPRQVVIYCGENDLASSDSVTAAVVVERFRKLLTLIREKLPDVPVVYVSIKPSPSRERLLDEIMEANKSIQQILARVKNAAFADVYHQMISRNGVIKKELFIEDNLHMNGQGYAIWQKLIQPLLLKD